jgi:prepilin-type N-terminal cleavage/methylation domain-containing protein
MLSHNATNREPTAPPRRASRARDGFTLIELLVALVLLDVGLLALVGTATTVTRRGNEDRVTTHALELASARLERAASLPCGRSSPTGMSESGAMSESWSATSGAFGTRTIEDSVTFITSRGEGTLVLRMGARC